MADNADQAPEDIGAPQSYLVLQDGTPVYDRAGTHVGKVEHVLADEPADVFHGLIITTGDGHRFARAADVDGIYERGVIVSVPADRLPEPSEDAAARVVDKSLSHALKKAWDWLVRPK